MPKESNYFEEAYELCGDSNPIVCRTATILCEEMIKSNRISGLAADGDFNMLYFFQSVIRTISSYGSVAQPAFTRVCSPIAAFHFPDDNDPWKESYFAKCGMGDKYIKLLTQESVPNGDSFDVRYALTIAGCAIDKPTLDWILSREDAALEDDEVNFDYWLSGFNSE